MAHTLIAYQLQELAGWEIAPAAATRNWMDETTGRVAYRCLPLAIANQAGWVLKCPITFTANWTGSKATNGVIITAAQGHVLRGQVRSHFGSGIITFAIPWLFRTEPGYGLLVRGPTNTIKENITPLDGLVETDWAPYTFTMNYRMHKPNVPVTFEKGEPVAMVCPYPISLLDETEPVCKLIQEDEALHKDYLAFVESRGKALETYAQTKQDVWQKHYMQGKRLDGEAAPEHRSRLRLKEFSPPAPLPGKPAG